MSADLGGSMIRRVQLFTSLSLSPDVDAESVESDCNDSDRVRINARCAAFIATARIDDTILFKLLAVDST